MSHQLFDELIGTPPPPRVDVKGIVRRERRASAARRLGGSLAAVLALAVAGGISVAVRHQEPGAARATPQAVASSPAADTRFRLVFDTEETADATAKRLSQELDRALRAVAPGATWTWMPDHLGEPRKPDGQPPEFTHRGTPDFVGTSSGISYQGRKGSLGVSITPDASDGPAGFHWPCQLPQGIPEDSRYRRVCDAGTTPNGALMKIETLTGTRQKSVQYLIAIQLPGDRALQASVLNMVGVDESAVPAQPQAPLSMEQLKAIALAIADQVKA
ncbi:hypothetical protein GA0070607_2688 [Micromonospora coriariae]|uniref:Uncharacterized protein n=1 Tax=Micromonospora coriariae TaxID=285665 RepID=A0A1C4VV10_9ACTN|nr:hypothetical protein [Micromonospora coriariae]SCE87813.1 hypothetical protein GA0070607_2688 [Micromonospora coriariae]